MENQENKNELTLFSGVDQKIYCSKVAETEKDKKELFNALENCDVLLNDCVNQEIEIKDIYVEEKEVVEIKQEKRNTNKYLIAGIIFAFIIVIAIVIAVVI